MELKRRSLVYLSSAIFAPRLQTAIANADLRKVSMIHIGSSTTAGTGAGHFTKRYMNIEADAIHSAFNLLGVPGGIHIFPDDADWINTGTQVGISRGLGFRSATLSAGATKLRTLTNCTGFELHYAEGPGFGTFTVTIDGGSPITITPDTSGVYRHTGTYTSGVLSRGTHTVLITATNSVEFGGMYAFDGDKDLGFRAYNSGNGNANSGTFINTANGRDQTLWDRAKTIPNCAGVLIMLGSNDWNINMAPSTFKANLLTLINAGKTALTTQVPDFILVNSFKRYDTLSPTYPYEAYGNAMAELAREQSRVYYLDISGYFPATNTAADDPEDIIGVDNTHLGNDAGHAFMGRLIAKELTRSIAPSLLDSGNTVSTAVTTVTGSTSLTGVHHTVLVDAGSGSRTINLPAASGITGKEYIIKKIDGSANTVTIDGNGSETIDGATTQVISTQYTSMTIRSNGSNWYIT
jgi:lysophospholipase L1-like esterase